jgi:guanylate kinase
LNTSRNGRLTVISGPSGVGKSTIVDAIIETTPSEFSVSATTRAPRTGEVEGVDYFFVDRDTFRTKIRKGEVLEWTEYGGNLYGTLCSSVHPILESGRNVLLDIENEGAKQIRAHFPEALLIFVAPPDIDTLRARLTGRGDTPEADMALRLSAAQQQISEAPGVYDHVVVNTDLERAISEVLDILGSGSNELPIH